jgi:hypothetical protein
MTITVLIKEGEEFRDSIGDSTHGIGKIQDSSKFYLWVERVVRYLGQTVPKDISIERFMHYSNQINPIHCNKSSFEGLLNILRAVEELPDVVIADDLVHRKKDDDKISIQTNVKQEQTQNQAQTVNVLETALKDSFAPFQLEELKEILKSNQPREDKRKSLMEKLKSFGSDVASGVLANILSNPEVLSMFV